MQARTWAGVLAIAAIVIAPATGRASEPTAAQGAALFARYCATCHGATAKGYGADNAPSLVSSTFQRTATDAFLRAAIERGRPGTAMAGFARALGGPLAPAEVTALVTFLRAGAPARVELSSEPVIGDADRGRPLYDAQCASCHGTILQRGNALHLANPTLLATASDAFLHYAVEHGRPGTRMEAWKGRLQAQQIDDVVAYVRSLAAAPPVPLAMESAPPLTRPYVVNSKGGAPQFTLREDRFVGIAQVKAALDQGKRMIIADARPPSDWRQLRITGAISLPYYDTARMAELPNDGTWVIAYCACPHHVSGTVVDELKKRGFPHAAVLDEGMFAWQQAGYPVVAAPGVLPVPAPPPSDGEPPGPPR